jgi:hypothetical protein
VVPFVVTEAFHEVGIEEPWRLDEEPMRRVDYFEISFMIDVPDL